jgi:hypothetical protein
LHLTACGGRKISNSLAEDLIVRLPQEALQKEDVEVVNVNQVGGTEAIVETRLKTAFRFEKVEGEWIIREVRLGHGQWEQVENLSRTLETVRTEETQKMLDQIAEAIRKYQESSGSLPVFKDYVSLSDLLSPRFLIPLIRLDAWMQPLGAQLLDSDSILLWSAGPDKKPHTSDDIRRTFPP